MKISFRVIIPVRLASTRLPRKPLLEIGGKPMLQHVYERAMKSGAKEVIIATCDSEIKVVAEAFGAKVCMTSKKHPSGTARLAEVVRKLKLPLNDIVVNVQGDEPLIPPVNIAQVANNLHAHKKAAMATLYEPIKSMAELFNPNIVKIVLDKFGYALYFSRAPIAWERDSFAVNNWDNAGTAMAKLPDDFKLLHLRHIGIYAYRVSFLLANLRMKPSLLEKAESLEQLRALYFGLKIHVARAKKTVSMDVNTVEDLEAVRKLHAI